MQDIIALRQVYRVLFIFLFNLLAGSCGLLLPEGNAGPIICFTFDDQHNSVYEYAFPALADYGWKATSFVNSGCLGRDSSLSWDQVQELELVYGWETGGHGLWHKDLVDLTYDEARREIGEDYNNLVNHGLNPRGFALPKGACPQAYYSIIMNYYNYVRCSSDFAIHPPIDRFSLGYISYQADWSADTIKSRIEQGIANKEALIVIGFHQIETPSSYMNCPLSVFKAILGFVHQKGLRVMTLSEALAVI